MSSTDVEVDRDLECLICKDFLSSEPWPQQALCCGKHFCKICVQKLMDRPRDKNNCPHCRKEPLRYKDASADFIARLRVDCPNKGLGCTWIGELASHHKHLNPDTAELAIGCGYVKVFCSSGCGKELLRGNAIRHELSTDCPCSLVTKLKQRVEELESAHQAMASQLRDQVKSDMTKTLKANEEKLQHKINTINKGIFKEFETNLAEVKALRKEFKKAQAGNEAIIKEWHQVKSETIVGKLQKELNESKKGLDDFKKKLNEHKKEFRNGKRQQHSHLRDTPVILFRHQELDEMLVIICLVFVIYWVTAAVGLK